MEAPNIAETNVADSATSFIKSKSFSSKMYFPSDVLKWMKLNAKPQMSLKLMKICKYFQHQQFPYFVIKNLRLTYGKFHYYSTLNDESHYCRNIEEIPNNLWITNLVLAFWPNSLTHLISKISFCEAKKVFLKDENISFDHFEVLVSSVKQLELKHTKIYDDIVDTVPLEMILESLPSVEDINFVSTIPSFSSIEAAKQVVLPNLRNFEFGGISNGFNIDAFIEFMDKHKNVKFDLSFFCDLQPFPHVQKLQGFVDEIIATADLQYPPPIINFSCETFESWNALMALRKTFDEKNS
uniref:Uncharacterized protein n=1 Tax=Panagrolaimus davidi TaxID=227884 RepID=A0A914PFQ0_9BILA